jgi:hypothetical protein
MIVLHNAAVTKRLKRRILSLLTQLMLRNITVGIFTNLATQHPFIHLGFDPWGSSLKRSLYRAILGNPEI